MPVQYFGSTPIKELTLTKSWGVNPATGELTCVGALSPAMDSSVWLSVGGTQWFGRVKGSQVRTAGDGITTSIRLVDNRDKLMQSCIFAQFNMMSGDSGMFHIFPGVDWYLQRKSTAYSSGIPPGIIVGFILGCVGMSWTVTGGDAFNLLSRGAYVIPNLDWNYGKKCGAALTEICDSLGLHFAIGEGTNTILIGRKGESASPLSGNFIEHSVGRERIFVDNYITIVGDQNIYELTEIPLYPDWPEDWNPYVWNTSTLLRDLYLINPSNPWNVTVEEFAQYNGYQFYDTETHAGYGRETMLVGDYIETIPFKVYGIELDTSISLGGGISFTFAELMPIYDRLVSDVDAQTKVKATSCKFDPHNPLQSVILAELESSSGYEVDRDKGKVIFNEKRFKSSGDICSVVGNQQTLNTGNIIADTPLLTFAVQRELFTASYGKGGGRLGSHHVRNLRKEYICNDGGGIESVVDRGVLPAEHFAALVAGMLLSRLNVATSGYAKRVGQSGYQLSHLFDRITVTLNASEGLSETVTYSNEEPQLGVPSERELERRMKAAAPKTDLAKTNELWDAVNAALSSSRQASSKSGKGGAGTASKGRPSGDEATDVSIIDPAGIVATKNYGSTFAVGEVLCTASIDETTGQYVVKDPIDVVHSDPSFLGVVIKACEDTGEAISVKTSGDVTVKVMGVVAIGDSLGVVEGETYCQAGKSGVGTAKEVKDDEGIGYVRAQLSGSGTGTIQAWFESTEPTPTAGKINIWYNTNDDHLSIYNWSAMQWYRVTGFMG